MFRMYLDETGTHDLGHVHQEAHRYFSLTGVILDLEDIREGVTRNLNVLKNDLFSPDPDEPLILHRKSIMERRARFSVLRDDVLNLEFCERLISFIEDTSFTTITAVVDKKAILGMDHWHEKNPYHYCLEILVEKFVQWLCRTNSVGDVLAERRGKKEDKALCEVYLRVISKGTRFIGTETFSGALTAKKLKMRRKEENITGLQIADLIAHPSYLYVRDSVGHSVDIRGLAPRIIRILKDTKYDRSSTGKISGYGIKYIP